MRRMAKAIKQWKLDRQVTVTLYDTGECSILGSFANVDFTKAQLRKFFVRLKGLYAHERPRFRDGG